MSKNYRDTDDDDILWRYMPLSKFVDILITESISFCRPDFFEDVYEGNHSDYIKATSDILHAEGATDDLIEMFEKSAIKGYQEVKYKSHVLCLHANQNESAAMWKLYGNQKDTVAIKTSVKSLKASLDSTITNQKLEFGLVNYDTTVDSLRCFYEADREPGEVINIHPLNFLYSKRPSFEHEKEYRVLALPNQEIFAFAAADIDVEQIKLNSLPVIKIACDPSILIEELVIAPDSPKWFVDMIKGLVEKLGWTFPINQSQLYTLN
ncbi:DUF2971 domain-containing protein [Acinetobacter baumannii]|nr:DUF2971 domain-containing protein [Acinetobacter baumannii]